MNKCDKCNKEFQSKCHLNRHKNRKKPCNVKEIYNCELCELNFKFESELNRHCNSKKHIINNNNYIDNSIHNNNIQINNITNNIQINGFSETNINVLTLKDIEDSLLDDNHLIKMLEDFEADIDNIFGYSEYIFYSFRYFIKIFSKLNFNLAHTENHNCDIYSFVKTKDNYIEYHLLEIDNIHKQYKTKCIQYNEFIEKFISLMRKINNTSKLYNRKFEVLLNYIDRFYKMIFSENNKLRIEEILLNEYTIFSEKKHEEIDEESRFQKSLLMARQNAFKFLTNSNFIVSNTT
jgi:hypothetical protein